MHRRAPSLPSGRLVIPDAAAVLARLNFRNRKFSRELMSSVKATQLRPGMVIQHEGQLFTVFSTEHRTPGNKRGSMQTRMKNLKTGAIIDYRFRAEEFVDRAILDEIEYEYLYK